MCSKLTGRRSPSHSSEALVVVRDDHASPSPRHDPVPLGQDSVAARLRWHKKNRAGPCPARLS